ncbi:hypothetical protein [Streptomyces sp. NBC_01373]|uniref:hypothetical protein n=1 Tax=Streptomyces sp. NBC_01373 TaxID=2903843 RepID=UPI00225756A3|nr:hypothetical protein [Streptomyces sp. NBC_01373]MCX4704405.1 hypothetical protein [Streptomyces sp. NBC_01373]
MRTLRRAVLLAVPALCALASCGIPTTGVVQAGGPASGVVPTIRVYFVADDTLVAVPRRTVAPVDVESAVEVLLEGPTEAERVKRMTTLLSLPGLLPTAVPAAPATDGAVPVPQEVRTADLVKVTVTDDRVSIELTAAMGDVVGLAADQLICTALGAQRVADPGSEPLPVTVTGPRGRRIEGTGTSCSDG